jgi:endonuclease/exonuclease/phosphatase (EEP) superfamily protein YafD
MRLPITLAALLMPHLAVAEDVTLRVLSFNIWYGGDQVSFDQTLAAIRAADADIVGLQEPDGKTRAIAAATGYPFVDIRRHIMSRFPLFDPELGERTETTNPPYSIAGVDSDAVQIWAMVAPGKVIGLANTHLTSDPYGPEMLRDGASVADTLANEAATRVPEAQALMQGLAPLARQGIPIILTGDFNTPSHLDWATRPTPVAWPTTQIIMDAGFKDTYRTAHPDPLTMPGLTWTAGRAW